MRGTNTEQEPNEELLLVFYYHYKMTLSQAEEHRLEAGRSLVSGLPGPQSEFTASLDNLVRRCLQQDADGAQLLTKASHA